jgi:hypothetical protein
LIRTRVALNFFQTTTAASAGFLALGIYVATGDEDDVTVPNVFWDPNTDHPSDWVYRVVFPIPSGTQGGTQVSLLGADTAIESLARRKIPVGAGILFVLDATGGANGNVALDVRTLIMSG